MNEVHQVDLQSPIGVVEITGTEEGILSIFFKERDEIVHHPQQDTPQVLKDCLQELAEYFRGERMEFTVPYISTGTEFQGKVWSALTTIGYAETASYRDIAVKVGSDKAVRAVGNANSKNKLSIIVPCHRIIGSTGKLTGYAGTLSRKEWLLKHEQKIKSESV
ncbi:methylated-DNA--[protein]-cysteine S-methyltransferase [Metaplanococcus flavidus]|uniref:Methylated-DNA--protein-cysteine methyltransferase n=1 Tax=Metaplanococcus flavidus TaxID=569883 RepID=A0ABW3LGI5_9BACL